ncbi:Macrocin-O-methyltransferase [Aureococcus anophagefferens]|uniref:Macrocin-O-methyltransferase n=1 Tax=Aureococcus anophagefferens TaxID=44056 RepID=A0ABR1G110_AURAN
MVGARLASLAAILRVVEAERVAGDVVELGSWRCGAAAFARRVLDAVGGGGASPARRRRGDARAAGASAVALHAGRFAETVPEFRATGRGVAVLRVDANFCGSYQDALYGLYDRVPVGGFVVFDDVMTHPEVMRCWLDFKADQGLPEDLVRALVPPPRSPARQQLRRPAWQTYHDDAGTPYYYDTDTGETTWTMPRALDDDADLSSQADDNFSQADAVSTGEARPSARVQRSRDVIKSRALGAGKRQEAYKAACDDAEARGEPAPDYVSFMTSMSEADAAGPLETAPAAAPPAAAMSAEEAQELEDRKRGEAARARLLIRMEASAEKGAPLPSSYAADDYMSSLEA